MQHHLSTLCAKQQTHLNLRVEGIARELKTYLVITLEKKNGKEHPSVKCVLAKSTLI